jgi:hypothetical protein
MRFDFWTHSVATIYIASRVLFCKIPWPSFSFSSAIHIFLLLSFHRADKLSFSDSLTKEKARTGS